jgi:hypothetical protein
MPLSQLPERAGAGAPTGLGTNKSYWCTTTVTLGDLVILDKAVATYQTKEYAGVSTSPTTADNPLVIGVALETVAGTQTVPKQVRVCVGGIVIKAKIVVGTATNVSLVSTAAAVGQLKAAGAGDYGGIKAVTLTAEGATYIDGTAGEAGFASVNVVPQTM